MTPKNIAIIACRLLAIWFFVQAMQSFANLISLFLSAGSAGLISNGFGSAERGVLYLSVTPLAYLGASVVLWLGALVFAGNIVREMEVEQTKSNVGIYGWQALGFSLIGMFVCAQGLTTLLATIGMNLFRSSASLNFTNGNPSEQVWSRLAVGAAQFLIGFALLFYAQRTIRVLDYVRRAGRDETLKNEIQS